MPLPQRKPLYLSLETDEEFRARVRAKYPRRYIATYDGEWLDGWVWDEYKMQRKLIERG